MEDFATGITIGFIMGICFSIVFYILKNKHYI